MTKAPAGEKFLPHTTYDELKAQYRVETKAKAKLRLQACMLRKKGRTLEDIASIVGYPLTTVGDWLRRVHQEGLARVHSKKQSGRPSYLTTTQKEEVKKILLEPPTEQKLPYRVWTVQLLGYLIDQRYQVKYKLRKLERLVHELGFNFLKARPEHKKANKALQETFKKKLSKNSNHTWKMDGRSYFLMKASSK